MYVDIAVDAMREYTKDTMHQRLSIDEYDTGIATAILDAVTEHIERQAIERLAREAKAEWSQKIQAMDESGDEDYVVREAIYAGHTLVWITAKLDAIATMSLP